MTRKEIVDRIKHLEAEPRALVGSDEGTHGKPLNHRIYEGITGERYAIASFGGANGTRYTEQSAIDDTEGRICYHPLETSRIRDLQRELKTLRDRLRKMD